MDIYRHYKGGIYKMICIATDTESGERKVIYQGIDGRIWDRSATMFFGTVEFEGKEVPRFVAIGAFTM